MNLFAMEVNQARIINCLEGHGTTREKLFYFRILRHGSVKFFQDIFMFFMPSKPTN